jgi:PilZ domain
MIKDEGLLASPDPGPRPCRFDNSSTHLPAEEYAENLKKPSNSMMWDRRRKKRGPLEEFVFIQIGRDDGGRVLNVSEGGLSFEVFSPIPQSGPVYFWFSPNLRERIEALGELTWTDAARKVGGLKFLKIRPQDRERIGTWVKQVSKAESAERQPVPFAKRTSGISTIQAQEPSSSKTSVALGRFSDPAPLQDSVASESVVPEVPESRSSFYGARLVPLERFLTATRRQFILGVLLGILVSAAVAIPAFKYSANKKQVTASPPVSGPTVAGKPDAQLDPQRTAPLSESAHAPLLDSAAGKVRRSAPAGLRHEDPFGSPSSQTHVQSPPPFSGDHLTATPVQPQPENPKGTGAKKVTATPQQLWASVQSGNTKAAVALADLYIRGDGVPVNCNQARVLLLVASAKSNADAIRKLRELDKTGGCAQP